MTYQPTGEQIEALAQGATTDKDWQSIPESAREMIRRWKRDDASKPAFQAIIRAAQAEAYERGLRHGFVAPATARLDRHPNPYKEHTA